MEIKKPEGFTNDGMYKCHQCEEGIMCFSTTGDTNFCPCCGARSDEFDMWEESE